MISISPKKEDLIMKKSRFTLYRIVIIGLMAAMVFVCTMFLGIRIPTPTGTTQLKTANAICLLTYPEWAAGAWLTFIFFFAMGAICGGIAHADGAAGKNKARNWLAAVCGAVGYWLLYVGKSILVLCLSGSAFSAAFIATTPKMLTGGINAVFAVVVSNLLAALLLPKLEAAGIFETLQKH